MLPLSRAKFGPDRWKEVGTGALQIWEFGQTPRNFVFFSLHVGDSIITISAKFDEEEYIVGAHLHAIFAMIGKWVHDRNPKIQHLVTIALFGGFPLTGATIYIAIKLEFAVAEHTKRRRWCVQEPLKFRNWLVLRYFCGFCPARWSLLSCLSWPLFSVHLIFLSFHFLPFSPILPFLSFRSTLTRWDM